MSDVVSIEEAIRRIGEKPNIHTFLSAPFGLVGADHDRDTLIAKLRKGRIENSGEMATSMGHTLVIVDYVPSPMFIEAAPAEVLDTP